MFAPNHEHRVGLGTAFIIIFCIMTYIFSAFIDLSNYSICASTMFEIYRLGTSAWFHVNMVHLLMNMASLFAISYDIEKSFGTGCFLGLVLFLAVSGNIIYLLLASFVNLITYTYQDDCLVGLSGVIFSLLTMRLRMIPIHEARDVFGLHIPMWMYPYIFIVFLSFFLSWTSFLGHLAGVLMGEFYYAGDCHWASSWFEPQFRIVLRNMEDDPSLLMKRIMEHPNYIKCPSDSPIIGNDIELLCTRNLCADCIRSCWGRGSNAFSNLTDSLGVNRSEYVSVDQTDEFGLDEDDMDAI